MQIGGQPPECIPIQIMVAWYYEETVRAVLESSGLEYLVKEMFFGSLILLVLSAKGHITTKDDKIYLFEVGTDFCSLSNIF